MDSAARARAIELLEATHVFPGDYVLTVVAQAWDQVTSQIRAVATAAIGRPVADGDYPMQKACGGKYLSHRLAIPCQTASEALDVHTRLRELDGVVSVL